MTVHNAVVCDAAMPIPYFFARGLTYLLRSLAVLISHLAAFSAQYRALLTLGFAHFQPGRQTRDAVDTGVSPLLLRSVHDPEM